jgi:phosphoribosylanthranilate isomerase
MEGIVPAAPRRRNGKTRRPLQPAAPPRTLNIMAHALRIKICGVTNERDLVRAAELGADAIGFNFHPASPRYVDPAACTPLLRALPPFSEAVGVFVDLPLRAVFTTLNNLGRVRTAQWYGRQREMADAFPFGLIQCFPLGDAAGLRAITGYLDMARSLNRLPSAILVDAAVKGQHGGTGQTVPWNLLADFQPGVPLILAGGLTPDNVPEAIRIVQPYAVDVASGVESTPGQKDAEKMKRFIERAREAAAKLS